MENIPVDDPRFSNDCIIGWMGDPDFEYVVLVFKNGPPESFETRNFIAAVVSKDGRKAIIETKGRVFRLDCADIPRIVYFKSGRAARDRHNRYK